MTVDDLVADIAVVFHWPPAVTDPMSLSELLAWRHKAMQRSGVSDG
ncbi:GpE family phage tail protein [Edwardsiella tarda]|nr:GpE family phage tail protein [Edwardsiella tarda]